ncbi:hypothetical protein C8Q74DRAFT_47316 [Fomes fomentarius]|nr:hypothetical protein C8Q74DRAFT_47316 [Fomes fomentarius]
MSSLHPPLSRVLRGHQTQLWPSGRGPGGRNLEEGCNPVDWGRVWEPDPELPAKPAGYAPHRPPGLRSGLSPLQRMQPEPVGRRRNLLQLVLTPRSTPAIVHRPTGKADTELPSSSRSYCEPPGSTPRHIEEIRQPENQG